MNKLRSKHGNYKLQQLRTLDLASSNMTVDLSPLPFDGTSSTRHPPATNFDGANALAITERGATGTGSHNSVAPFGTCCVVPYDDTPKLSKTVTRWQRVRQDSRTVEVRQRGMSRTTRPTTQKHSTLHGKRDACMDNCTNYPPSARESHNRQTRLSPRSV